MPCITVSHLLCSQVNLLHIYCCCLTATNTNLTAVVDNSYVTIYTLTQHAIHQLQNAVILI